MPRAEFDVETRLPPDRVIAALTDFTERRPQIWSGLAPEYYEVYSVGETSAEIREGSTKPMRVWARETYDWSTPGTVTWTVEESPYLRSGVSYVSAKVEPAEGGGSRIHVTWDRSPTTFVGRVLLSMIALMKGKPLVGYIKKSLDKLADQPT
jgi:hypothetical protein